MVPRARSKFPDRHPHDSPGAGRGGSGAERAGAATACCLVLSAGVRWFDVSVWLPLLVGCTDLAMALGRCGQVSEHEGDERVGVGLAQARIEPALEAQG